MQGVVIARYTDDIPSQANNYELVVASPPDGGMAVLMLQYGAYLQELPCQPMPYRLQGILALPRPAGFASPQDWEFDLNQTGCVNVTASAFSSNVPIADRCYAAKSLMRDIKLPGLAVPQGASKPQPTNYVIWLRETFHLCPQLLKVPCVEAYGPYGCALCTYGARLPPGSAGNFSAPAQQPGHGSGHCSPEGEPWDWGAPVVPSAVPLGISEQAHVEETGEGAGEGGSGSSSDRAAVLGAAIGGALGGCALLAGLAAAVLLYRRRRAGQPASNPSSHRPGSACPERPTSSPCGVPSSCDNDVETGLTIVELAAACKSATSTPLCTTGDVGAREQTYTSSEAPWGHEEAQGTAPPLAQAPGPQQLLLVGEPVTVRTQYRRDMQLGVQVSGLGDEPPRSGASTDSAAEAKGDGVSGREDSDVAAQVTMLNEPLGKGTYGSVCKGLYRGQPCAVKVVGDVCGVSHAPEGALLRSFQQEVEVLGRCQHPNVVRLLAACLTPPKLCLVMELMEASLDWLLHRPGAAPLPLDTVLHIGVQVAAGLEYLHPTIVHRDLKPANVLLNDPLSPRPTAKLGDFGLSRLRMTVAATQTPDAGTPAYLSPEAFDTTNDTITHHHDMFALGVLLWEMLTGQHPWEGHTQIAIGVALVLHKRRLPLHQLPPERCPPRVRALIAQCWDADPRRRPAAAEAVKSLTLELQTGAAAALEAGRAGPHPPGVRMHERAGDARALAAADALGDAVASASGAETAHYGMDALGAASTAVTHGGSTPSTPFVGAEGGESTAAVAGASARTGAAACGRSACTDPPGTPAAALTAGAARSEPAGAPGAAIARGAAPSEPAAGARAGHTAAAGDTLESLDWRAELLDTRLDK